MAAANYGSLQVSHLRMAALLPTGAPDVGLENGYSNNNLLTFDPSPQFTSDVDLTKENGEGDSCQSYFKQGTIKRVDLSTTACELDLNAAYLAVGASLFRTIGTSVPMGFQIPKAADGAPDGVCLEIWTKAWAGTVQATPTELGGELGFWHFVFPWSRFRLDKWSGKNDFLDFALTGFSSENENLPHTGPFGDWPDYVSATGIQAAWAVFMDTAPATATSDALIAVPAVAS